MRLMSVLLFLVACGVPEPTVEPTPSWEGSPFTFPDVEASQVPPVVQDLVLTIDPLTRGELATFHVSGAQPGERVYILRAGAAGAGPCSPSGALCLDITNPVSVLATPRADGAGEVSFTITVPDTLPAGAPYAMQAVVTRGAGWADSSTSGVVEGEILNPIVRFIAMGDAGEGNAAQYQNADAIETICAQRGCDFALYMGDNFYDAGVTAVNDAQFQTKFEDPYANLEFPFYVVTGNHDFGEVPLWFWRTDYQIEYSDYSTKWTMFDNFYTFGAGHADFFALDTNIVMLNLPWSGGDPDAWMAQALAGSTAEWKIAYGHHPYRSNGQHGNAGNYEGAWFDITGLVRGDNVEDFMDDHVCGNIDIYLCGHDHNRQWLSPECGTEFIVAGTGAKTTDLENRDNNPTIWQDDTEPGFVWVELDGNEATIAFYDFNGDLDYSGTIIK